MIKERGSELKRDKTGKEAAASPKAARMEGWKRGVQRHVLGFSAWMERLKKPWDSATWVFDFHKAENTLSDAMPDADMRLAIRIFILAGIITFIVSFITLIGSAFLINTESDAISAVTGVAAAKVGIPELIGPVLLAFIVFVPIAIIANLILETAAFYALRLIGGKARFAEQLYLSSIVALALAFASGLNIFSPLPILQIIGGMCLIAANIYLAIFVESKAYSVSHRIHFVPGLVMALLIAIAKFLILYFSVNAVAALLGLPPQMASADEIISKSGG